MALGKPNIDTPRALELRVVAQAIGNIRQRVEAIEALSTTTAAQAGETTLRAGQQNISITALRTQLVALAARVDALTAVDTELETFRAGSAITIGTAVYPSGDGVVSQVDPSDPLKIYAVLGVATQTAVEGANVIVRKAGVMQIPDAVFEVGGPVFVGVAGLTQFPDYINLAIPVGVATSTDEMDVRPGWPALQYPGVYSDYEVFLPPTWGLVLASMPQPNAPTAAISFQAVDGVADDFFMRSDAAPALATTLVTLGTESFSLSTASDLGDPATRGSITLTAGDNDTFVGSSLVVGGAGASNGVLTATAGGALTLAAGTTAAITATSLTATTTSDMTLTVGGSFTATTDATLTIASGEEMSITAVDSIVMLTGVDFLADAGGEVTFGAVGAVNFSSTDAAVLMTANTAVRLSAQTGITLTTGAASEAEFAGEVAVTGRQFGNPADAKVSVFSASVETTDATPTEVETTTGGFIVLANDSSYVFAIDVAARNTGNDAETAAFTLQGVIRRGTNAASTTVVGTPVLTVLAQDTGTTTWTCAFAADTTNGRPAITVTGEAAKNVRWVAGVTMTKVSG